MIKSYKKSIKVVGLLSLLLVAFMKLSSIRSQLNYVFERETTIEEKEKRLYSVKTELVKPFYGTLKYSLFGSINNFGKMEIYSPRKGQIDFLNNKIVNGTLIQTGEILLGINHNQFKKLLESHKRKVHILQKLIQTELKKDKIYADLLHDCFGYKGTSENPKIINLRLDLEKALIELQQSRMEYDNSVIIAPYDCYASKVKCREHDYVKGNDVLISILPLKSFEVEARISLSKLNLIDFEDISSINIKLINEENQSYKFSGFFKRLEDRNKDTKELTVIFGINSEISGVNVLPYFLTDTFYKIQLEKEVSTGYFSIPVQALKRTSEDNLMYGSTGTIWLVRDGYTVEETIEIVGFEGNDIIVKGDLHDYSSVIVAEREDLLNRLTQGTPVNTK